MPYSHRPSALTARSSLPKTPLPTRKIFDPYNSTSSGHQCGEVRQGGLSWNATRTVKLAQQFGDTSGHGGREHLLSLLHAKAVKDGQQARETDIGQREVGLQDIKSFMSGSRKRKHAQAIGEDDADNKRRMKDDQGPSNINETTQAKIAMNDREGKEPPERKQPPQIFRGLTMFINGSTAPLISDLKLKQLIVQHGGNSSIALGKRTVTHVVLGNTCGGGLASTKIQKEVTTVGGKKFKYVTAQWVLNCIEKGTKVSEGPYMPKEVANRIGGSGQESVRAILTPVSNKEEAG